VQLTTLHCKRGNVEKPPRNSAGFCGGGEGPSWAVEPRKEECKQCVCEVMAQFLGFDIL
jgi:hypothetical protein